VSPGAGSGGAGVAAESMQRIQHTCHSLQSVKPPTHNPTKQVGSGVRLGVAGAGWYVSGIGSHPYSVDQWISGGRRSHGGAEARRKQREESTTGHKGN
jgi:hypothetical protein